MAHNYHKIVAPFCRENNKDTMVSEDLWSNEAFEYLKDNKWLWEEKLDGSSIGLRWDGERLSFVGHTDKSQIAPKYLNWLNEIFGNKETETVFEELFNDKPFTVYGEGLSSVFNKHYDYPDGALVIYDVQDDTTGRFLKREAVAEIAAKLSCKTAPLVFEGTIAEAVAYVKQGPESVFAKGWAMEGLIGRPKTDLYDRSGKRTICKVKVHDFCGSSYTSYCQVRQKNPKLQ